MAKSATQQDFDERLESFQSIVIPPRVKHWGGRYCFSFNLWGASSPNDASNFMWCIGESFSRPDWLLIFWNGLQDNPNCKTIILNYYPKWVFTSAELAQFEEILDTKSPIPVFWFFEHLTYHIRTEKAC